MILKLYRLLLGTKRILPSLILTVGLCFLFIANFKDTINFDARNVKAVSSYVQLAEQDFIVENITTWPLTAIAKPFDSTKPKMLIILGYQRTGSTFTGKIFDMNPKVYTIFEPIDGIYGAMYGSRPGFAVPSDISNFWNGTERAIPDYEMSTIADVITSLLHCDFEKVPTEVLIHRFMFLFKSQQHRLSPYVKCLVNYNLTIPFCRHHIENTCPERFGEDMEKEDYCRQMLWDKRTNYKPFIGEDDNVFDSYQTCMEKQRSILVNKCLPKLTSVCENSQIRTTKTVRLNMETARLLLKQVRNLRLIHLIRDPRAVVLSRTTQSTYHAQYSGRSLDKEALLYCRGIVKDVLVRNQLQHEFPGSLFELIYEQFASSPQNIVNEIYAFLNETIPDAVDKWLIKNTGGEVKNSTEIAEKWKDKMKYIDVMKINSVCDNMFKIMNHKWG